MVYHPIKNKKPFIHIWDEEFSFDKLRTGLRGTTRITFSSWNVLPFKPANVT
jgi:hypothetical protein